jgi:threonylcarbamoyladenosine tRNA methylthiotransferase MtaB
MRRLSLSSLDPAGDLESIINLIGREPRMTRHLHLSVQSGNDEILKKMGRRHNAAQIRDIAKLGAMMGITFSWDIICGFPGETPDMFAETVALAQELRPTKIHAFPFSARPGTLAAEMPDQISRAESKKRAAMLNIR